MNRNRRISAVTVLALSTLATGTGAGFAATTTPSAAPVATHAYATAPTTATAPTRSFQGTLPAPTGPYAAGEDVIHLTDWSRLDPWVPSSGPRQLTVTMAYPAGVDMDGSFYPVPTPGQINRPFLMLGRAGVHSVGGGDATWGQAWAALGGYRKWLAVTGADHPSFTDVDLLEEEAGFPTPPLDPERGIVITREYVTAFFDQTLKRIHSPLLDGPSPLPALVQRHVDASGVHAALSGLAPAEYLFRARSTPDADLVWRSLTRHRSSCCGLGEVSGVMAACAAASDLSRRDQRLRRVAAVTDERTG
ncbi:hypothetical protein [Catenulispora rubra]|uniref:hypothetical protein n=1 Tax=Catenulispora rubra TaxID=280293 RepID=UPI001E625599|nr:hypothetical protein [Catenulispora rubra]